ncbi:hypothetical protein K438DRAFT_2134939 [Mycena galopus ATCC 62051]|nr:hypothetical protein K438DRAFT_2134939 [Mycena galopus ATCC 62051]
MVSIYSAVYCLLAANLQEQCELESGKTVLNGRPAAVNTDFARQVIFLSQQLETSERYVAGLLHSVTAQNPNIQAINCIELTIAEFHQRRRHLTDCLGYIFEAAEAADLSDKSSIFYRIWQFVDKDLVLRAAGGGITLAQHIVREIQSLGNLVARADAARKGARTSTVPPSVQGTTPSLGYNILNSRYESLKYERRCLATCLSIIARLGHLSLNEIKVILDWLSTVPNQLMTFYLLTSVLSVFDPVDPEAPGSPRATLVTSSDLNLALTVLQLDRKWGSSPVASFVNTLTLSPEQQEQREVPSDDFIPVVFSAFEILVRSLIIHASSELRKIKQRQEDLVIASARTDRTRAAPARFTSTEPDLPVVSPRSDIAMLYSFIGLLYSALPAERVLQFWGSNLIGDSHTYLEYLESTMAWLPAFLQWAVWSTQVHDVSMSTALYDMLAGLTNCHESPGFYFFAQRVCTAYRCVCVTGLS